MTLGVFLDGWLAGLHGAVHAHTIAAYRSAVVRHLGPALGAVELAELTRDMVRAFVLTHRREGRSAQVCRLRLAVLRRALFDAVDAGHLRENPATNLWRRTPPELRVRRQPGRYALRNGCGTAVLMQLARDYPDMYRLVLTYALSGMRRNEGLGLQISDLDFQAGTITIRRQWHGGARRGGKLGPPKGRRERTIDMAEELRPVLEEAVIASHAVRQQHGCAPEPAWLFRSARTGRPWSPTYVNYVLGRVGLEAAGMRIGPKAYRHTVATTLMNGGVSPRYVQGLLGHAHLQTTMLYVAEDGIRDPGALRLLAGKGGR